MDKQKPISGEQITARALLIACQLFEKLEIELEPGKGPATEREIRRRLRGLARRELLQERKRTRTP